MGAFARGEIQVLVATTVVEVGVDVAERHGDDRRARRAVRPVAAASAARPGRPRRAPVVLRAAVSGADDRRGEARLDALVETTDGFVIAERDLELRGPGDFFGTRQSGLPTLRVGDLLRDHALMEDARREAVAALDDPAQTAALAAMVSATWEQRFGLVGVG